MEINWYPGHMAKTRRQLSEQISKVDLVIELCDARLPYSSRNPDLDKMIGNRNRIMILNKGDLADPSATENWIKYFRRNGIKAYAFNAISGHRKEILSVIAKATAEITEKYARKGAKKTLRAMVVGVPNVGKSTFINLLHGTGVAITGDKPGVTKNNQWIKITPYLDLMDSPGLLWPRLNDQVAARRLCYIGSVKDDVVDVGMLTIHLLQDIAEKDPSVLVNRFHMKSPEAKGVELLDDVCRGRGFRLKANEYDYDRCCSVVLDEFRAGKLGRMTLEQPPEEKEIRSQESTENEIS